MDQSQRTNRPARSTTRESGFFDSVTHSQSSVLVKVCNYYIRITIPGSLNTGYGFCILVRHNYTIIIITMPLMPIIPYVYCKLFEEEKRFAVIEINRNLLENICMAKPTVNYHYFTGEVFWLPIDPRKAQNFSTLNDLQYMILNQRRGDTLYTQLNIILVNLQFPGYYWHYSRDV